MEEQKEYKNITEMLLYKMDRTLAIMGIILMGAWALSMSMEQIATAAIGGLIGYVGGRVGK